MAAGRRTATRRTATLVTAITTTIPSRRFQPACKLGNAAYWFVRPGGCSAR
jgi:hypothetical protein